MKRLVLIRHAATEFGGISGADINRRLTAEGRDDAKKMATHLLLQHILPEEIYSSSAVRAMETAGIFSEVLSVGNDKITTVSSLYEPGVAAFYTTVSSISDKTSTAFIFSHNPGVSDFINEMQCHPPVQMPPCGVFAIQMNVESWEQFASAQKQFWFYLQPED